MARRHTRLSMVLAEEQGETRTTPLDVFRVARDWWLSGRRLNLVALADEVGVSRATLFRWVGNKELLLGEILWSMYAQTFDYAVKEAEGTGIDYIVDVYRRIAEVAVNFEPLKRFLRHEGLRVTLVVNVTDVNDKIYDAARAAGVPSAEHAAEMIRLYEEDTNRLGLGRPDAEPRATETMPEIIELIGELIAKGHAYESGGDVYFPIGGASSV